MVNSSKKHGFTLIEIIVVVAVIGLLLSLNYSSKQTVFDKNHEALVKAFLLEVSSRQANYWQKHGAYAGNLSGLKVIVPKKLAQHYTIEIEKLVLLSGQQGFLVKAIPLLQQDMDRHLWINHLGEKSANWAF
ncbi:MAG: prepilin-type N-terminal cleavage/methylation domain-containing protein [Porticoccaceae bacterium]|nr:prepilin-type N-terminal cleavage/methylation domain-containing protein [Porticoccaceae bacterium]